jgi:hypothetical protein
MSSHEFTDSHEIISVPCYVISTLVSSSQVSRIVSHESNNIGVTKHIRAPSRVIISISQELVSSHEILIRANKRSAPKRAPKSAPDKARTSKIPHISSTGVLR